MLACVPSKTIVEQRWRQVKPDRRERDNKQKFAVSQYWQYWHQQYWTISYLQPSASKVSLCWSDCSCCFDTIFLSCLIYHISIENLQNPFSQFQGAVVPNNQLKISLLVRISSTRRPLATREITQFPPWWQCALTLIIRWGGSLSGSQSKEALWIFKICKYFTHTATLIWPRFCCKGNMFDKKISFKAQVALADPLQWTEIGPTINPWMISDAFETFGYNHFWRGQTKTQNVCSKNYSFHKIPEYSFRTNIHFVKIQNIHSK